MELKKKKQNFCGAEMFEYTCCCTHLLSLLQVKENALCAKGELIIVHLIFNFKQQPWRRLFISVP